MKWMRGLAFLILAIGALGYASAWSAKQRCADLLYAELDAQHIVGLDLHEDKVPLTRDMVSADVTAPFEVLAYVSMPRDLHATVYAKRFRAWPWGVSGDATEMRELVMR